MFKGSRICSSYRKVREIEYSSFRESTVQYSYTQDSTLRKKCPYSEFFWSVFSRIRTECRKIRTRKTPNTDSFYAEQVIEIFKSH